MGVTGTIQSAKKWLISKIYIYNWRIEKSIMILIQSLALKSIINIIDWWLINLKLICHDINSNS